MSELPTFSEFYRAIHQREPFPWQARLADLVAETGAWPTEIGVATGLGKTACLDIAIWWLASEATLSPDERRAPTRIWWLVNRRLLVDATADHAERLAGRLRQETEGPIAAVGSRLRDLSADPGGDPLEVARLRGSIEARRPTDPSQPAVILSTLPMYGSRLLFRGYGSSRSMRPIDAALAGTDSLVLVDEAHLAHHLMALLPPLGECDQAARAVLPPARSRPTVVSLTATGASPAEQRFALDEGDFAHDEVAQRLGASKPVRIIEPSARAKLGAHLASAAAELLDEHDEPSSCVIFTNTPATAREVVAALRKDLTHPVVLTGRQRQRESAAARDQLLDMVVGAPAARPAGPRERHLVVVATQTLEVGADLDFDHLVTEACGVRSLTQRLGRLNRLGRSNAHASAAYVHSEPTARGNATPSWPVYGEEPLAVIDRLREAANDGEVDLGPGKVGTVLGAPGDDPGRAPEILPALLWEWVKTTTPPPGEAPVEPYFSGLAQPTRRVSVCWRAHVPEGGSRIWPRVRDREVVEIPLIKENHQVLAEMESLHRLASDRVTVEEVSADDLRPGDTLILATDIGMLDEQGWNPEGPATDVYDMSLPGRGLPLDREAISRLVTNCPPAALDALLENGDSEEEVLVARLLDSLIECEARTGTAEEWIALIESLDRSRGIVSPPREVPRLAARDQRADIRIDALDELSAGAAATALDAHGAGVGARADAVARAAGVAPPLIATVTRAAQFHDAGKADPRFQRWLDPRSTSDELLAKSSTPTSRWRADRVASGWPEGGRHEALSARMVEAWLAEATDDRTADLDPELLVHLVVSHHGHARPLLLPVVDDTSVPLTATIEGLPMEISTDLGDVDWDQPGRFARLNRRYGHWGLALLEAIVRQADHAVSAGAWAGHDEEVI